MNITFEGKVALVTGAAGGIGLSTARMFAESGAAVALVDISPAVMERADELNKNGHKAIGIICDVFRACNLHRLVKDRLCLFGVPSVNDYLIDGPVWRIRGLLCGRFRSTRR